MKNRFKRRRRTLLTVAFVTLASAVWYLYLLRSAKMDILGFGEEMVAMTLSTFASTFLAIWLTRNDILEDDFSQKKERFGVITFEDGYRTLFNNDDGESYLHVHNWKEFFEKNNKDKRIDIVGIALRGFFENENSSLPRFLLTLCLKNNFAVRIIMGNPYSDEVKVQAIGQYKGDEDHISSSILTTYNYFRTAINQLDEEYLAGNSEYTKKPSELLEGKFYIAFSRSLPKALIIRSGTNMLVTPYQMHREGPSVAPTLIVKDSDSSSFFDQYIRYIERLKELSIVYEMLQPHIMASSFFDQPYGDDLSKEFKNDLRTCSSLDILGLGQNKMFTLLEHDLIKIVQRGGTIRAVMAKPDGASTNMCVARSLIHENVEEARREHKRAINILISIRNRYARNNDSVKAYTWDCFFPYTMYAFNSENPSKCRIYIWVTNLFAYSNERDGFVLDGKFEIHQIEKYLRQYQRVIQASIDCQGEITDLMPL